MFLGTPYQRPWQNFWSFEKIAIPQFNMKERAWVGGPGSCIEFLMALTLSTIEWKSYLIYMLHNSAQWSNVGVLTLAWSRSTCFNHNIYWIPVTITPASAIPPITTQHALPFPLLFFLICLSLFLSLPIIPSSYFNAWVLSNPHWSMWPWAILFTL